MADGTGRVDKTLHRGLCFIGIAADTNSVRVECSDGKILRIRPLQYDEKYPELKPGITLDTYSHCLPALSAEAAQRVASLVVPIGEAIAAPEHVHEKNTSAEEPADYR